MYFIWYRWPFDGTFFFLFLVLHIHSLLLRLCFWHLFFLENLFQLYFYSISVCLFLTFYIIYRKLLYFPFGYSLFFELFTWFLDDNKDNTRKGFVFRVLLAWTCWPFKLPWFIPTYSQFFACSMKKILDVLQASSYALFSLWYVN